VNMKGILVSYISLVTASIAGVACFWALASAYLPYSSAKWAAAGVRFPIEFYMDMAPVGVDMQWLEQHSARLHQADALYQKLLFLDFLASAMPVLLVLLALVITLVILSQRRRRMVNDSKVKKFSPDQILAIVVSSLSTIGISFCKICDWKTFADDGERNFHARRIANWSKHFSQAQHTKWIDPSEFGAPGERAKRLESARQTIADNHRQGQPFWRGLDSRQLVLLLGHEPITLLSRRYKGLMPCYFDKDRNSIIIDERGYGNPNNSTLAELDPDLQTLVPKFHLKESPYVPGVYGLDPDHDKEHIDELSGHRSLNYE